jgi:hypothetical protein
MDLTGQAASSTIGARAMAAGTPFWAKHGEKHGENHGKLWEYYMAMDQYL